MRPVASEAPATWPSFVERFREVRAATVGLLEPLTVEDHVVQSMADASPVKWHLAHVSWFFETFVLKPHLAGYRVLHPQFEYLFNSYYNTIGEQFPRPQRGVLTRPTVEEVHAYRRHVDEEMERLLDRSEDVPGHVLDVLELGLNHEQQHQELILMDLKHLFSLNPLGPAYRETVGAAGDGRANAATWLEVPEGMREMGHDGSGFSFDNERPRHRVFVPPFRIASRLVTNGEYREFVESDGYARPDFWLADGWTTVRSERWTAPLYWSQRDGDFMEFTLAGWEPLRANAPICHVSYYEASAFAAWSDARLPTESEWETVASARPIEGNFLENGCLHPMPARRSAGRPAQMFGDVWEWTQNAYAPYPGYRPAEGAFGEYNGKFMVNQYVLRGGSCATPRSHVRPTYRNFFPAASRWMFSGIRLARDPGRA